MYHLCRACSFRYTQELEGAVLHRRPMAADNPKIHKVGFVAP